MLWFIVVPLLQLPVIVSGFNIKLPLESINTTVRYNSTSGTYDVGPTDSFRIECTYSNLPVHAGEGEVRWAVYSSPSALRKRTLYTNSVVKDDTVSDVSPLEVPRNPQEPLANGTISLTLSHANRELYSEDNPALTYQCKIVVVNDTVPDTAVQLEYTKNITISIVEPAKIVDVIVNSTSPNTEITEGDNVTLECVAEGYPRPTITWSREDGKALVDTKDGGLEYKGSIINLNNVTEAAAANYTCSVRNRVTGVPPTNSVNIEVLHKPVLTVHSVIVYQKVGYHTELKCGVKTSNPLPDTAYWYYKSATTSADEYNIDAKADDSRLKVSNLTQDHVSTLTIEPVTKEDFDRYYCCVISNSVGKSDICIAVKGSDTVVNVNGEAPRKQQVTSRSNHLSACTLLVVFLCFLSISFLC